MNEQIHIPPPVPLPGQPTEALPGSEEKVLVMIDRAARREQLFHPLDGRGHKRRSPLQVLQEVIWRQPESA